jgi:hypothetical protein
VAWVTHPDYSLDLGASSGVDGHGSVGQALWGVAAAAESVVADFS